MLKHKQRLEGVLGELMHYMLQGHPQKVNVAIEDLGGRIQVVVEDAGARRSRQECQEVERWLNLGDRSELKDYYSGLATEGYHAVCDLRLVGMLVDGGHIETTPSGVRITVWWKDE